MNIRKPEVQQIADALTQMGIEKASLSPSYFYAHLPLALIDAIYSIGVRYGQVQQAIRYFSQRFSWTIYRPLNSSFPELASQKSISDLVALFDDSLRHQQESPSLFSNRGFVNPASNSPTRKADVVWKVALILQRRKIEFFQDLQVRDKVAGFDDEFKSLPGQSSEVALRYFRMLTGTEDEIKPDRWILRFFAENLGRSIKPDETIELVQAASETLHMRGFCNVTPRLIDHLIWSKQRSRPNMSISNPATRLIVPQFILNNVEHEFPFDKFWVVCRAGGEIGNLQFGVDEDERLFIRSQNCREHDSGKCYRVKRSTVRIYVTKIQERAFRANHGWFSKVFDCVMNKL